MKNYEFNNWIGAVKEAFPKFNPHSEVLLSGWKQALGDATLDEAKMAIVQYVANFSSRFEPQPKDIRDIIADIRKNRVQERTCVDCAEPDFPEKKFAEDLANGVCRHNLYLYRLAAKINNGGDFKEALEKACLQRTGRIAEFPSELELQKQGLSGVRANPAEARALLESFYSKGCKL